MNIDKCVSIYKSPNSFSYVHRLFVEQLIPFQNIVSYQHNKVGTRRVSILSIHYIISVLHLYHSHLLSWSFLECGIKLCSSRRARVWFPIDWPYTLLTTITLKRYTHEAVLFWYVRRQLFFTFLTSFLDGVTYHYSLSEHFGNKGRLFIFSYGLLLLVVSLRSFLPH